MRKRTPLGTALLAVLVVAGMTVPAIALSTSPGQQPASTGQSSTTVAQAQNNSSVNVTVGQQLSTVISVSSDEVQTDFENTAFELSVERAGDEAKAEAIAERAEELHERTESIREDYEEASEEFAEGEISKSEYARQLAILNARASNVLNSYEQLQQRTSNVSKLELRAAGVNQSGLEDAVGNLNNVTGSGTAALLEQFTGDAEGKVELETETGLSIEVKSEDGERSREFERPGDDSPNITVDQSAALGTARSALSTPTNGSWVLTESKVKQDEGVYEFAFSRRNATNLTGEAEVTVDGSSGNITELEEKVERRDDREDDERDDDERDEDGEQELTMVVTEGTPAPNATITLQTLVDGEPAANVTVTLNEQVVGTTDANGTVAVTVPASGEAKLRAERGEAEGELEFEFESEDDEAEDDEAEGELEGLNVNATLDDSTVTVAVTYNGSGVQNASVFANNERVGTTGTDGSVSFAIDTNTTEDLELKITKGEFEAEFSYAFQNGSLVPSEAVDDDELDEQEDDDQEDDEREDDDTAEIQTLDVNAILDGDSVTVSVSHNGSDVANATVEANGEQVGSSGTNGTVSFSIDTSSTEDLELTVDKGEAETELTFAFEDGSLVQTGSDQESGDTSTDSDDSDDSDEDSTDDDSDDSDEDSTDDDSDADT